ncbi:hypothetical protein EDB81DRAFT_860814 [Dactylonectria macrodidyma]|uniref:Uncharacterized protein n=1 Tax=Dactylonectria macrodidyma TaxID=307937 RepID=A0A9P9DSX9_9HYPO|nr:hypothetical protein EDB81DRAFT_860814 [Dactylonectria macrodidyma]
MFNRDPYVLSITKASPNPSVASFKPDGVLHLGPDPTKGREALRKLHDKMIHSPKGPVVKSQHWVDRLFMLGGTVSDKIEVVVTGLHENVLRDGTHVMMDFASWVIISKGVGEGLEIQAEIWRVFQDQAKMMEALMKLEDCSKSGISGKV